jgi:Transposase DDE domain
LGREAEVGGAENTVDQEATMDADLDTLCTVVYCTADDLLPERQGNARRRVTDAEVVTLCVAQAIMGIPSDRRFLKVARKRLTHLFPAIPSQPAYFKRRRRLVDQLEWLMTMFASQSPGFKDDLLLIDSTPVECARSRETVKRSALADAADYGWCASHSRYFWGFRLHALFALDGTPRALTLASPKHDDREVGLTLLERCNRHGGETVLGDKNYAGRDFASAVSDLDATIVRPRRKDETGHGPHLAPIRQRIESIFWTCKDLLTLERHGARTLQGLRERVLQRFLTLAACVSLNHQLGRPSRALVDYVA